jgi:hypothetical protein
MTEGAFGSGVSKFDECSGDEVVPFDDGEVAVVGAGGGVVVVVDGTVAVGGAVVVVVVDDSGAVVVVLGRSAAPDAANAGDAIRRKAASVAVTSCTHRWRTELVRRAAVRNLTEQQDP